MVQKNFLQSALVPILIIEVTLLLLYFGINSFIAVQNKETLLEGAKSNIREIVSREASSIDNQLKEITRLSKIVQENDRRILNSWDQEFIDKSKVEFATADNGVFYKTTSGGSSLYYANNTKIGQKERGKAILTEKFDPLYKSVTDNSDTIVATYFNSFDNLNRYYPYIPDVASQYPPDLVMEDYNFYYEADEKHNPERKPVWTDVYLDPAGQGWMLSCVVPIYNSKGDFLEGVTGMDITVDKFLNNILNLQLPWEANAMLVNRDGMILALPEKLENIFDLKELKEHTYHDVISEEQLKPEEFNILKNKNSDIVEVFSKFIEGNQTIAELNIDEKEYLLLRSVVDETEWNFFVLVDKAKIFAPIYELEQLSQKIGYLAIFGMIIFYGVFFFVLSRKSMSLSSLISRPIEALARATTHIGKDLKEAQFTNSSINEIDTLLSNFSSMNEELNSRTEQLIKAKVQEELKEKEAQLAYNAGLFESASSYLHNIGNSLSGIDAKALQLNKVIDSMKNYGAVFGKIRESVGESKDLDKFEKILTTKVQPMLSEYVQDIVEIRDHIAQSIKHQQDSFNSSKSGQGHKFIFEFDVQKVIRTVIDDFEPTLEKRGINLSVNVENSEELTIKNQKHQFISGITNLMKNAIDAVSVGENSPKSIDIKIFRDGESVKVSIKDNGIGITSENMDKIFNSGFTTKRGGHGLGLHSFVNFLNENGGEIKVNSDGLNQGAEFIVGIKSYE